MKRILVIDDEEFVREALERVLASDTTEVMVAADAAAGLVALASVRVDLVIIDVVLPGMDGRAAIKLIRRDHTGIPIIAISGGGKFGLNDYQPEAIVTNAYLAACEAAGADATLSKPFETAELLAAIDAVMGAATSAAS